MKMILYKAGSKVSLFFPPHCLSSLKSLMFLENDICQTHGKIKLYLSYFLPFHFIYQNYSVQSKKQKVSPFFSFAKHSDSVKRKRKDLSIIVKISFAKHLGK